MSRYPPVGTQVEWKSLTAGSLKDLDNTTAGSGDYGDDGEGSRPGSSDSVGSMMRSLEQTSASQLTWKQRAIQEAAGRVREQKSWLSGTGPPSAVFSPAQKWADADRSQPLPWKCKARVPHRGALPPRSYQGFDRQLIPEQRAVGVRLGARRGDGGGVLHSLLGRRERGLEPAATERAWAGGLRNAFGNCEAPRDDRRSRFASNRATVMGAEPNRDHITQPMGRRLVANSFQRGMPADLAVREELPVAVDTHAAGMPDGGPPRWFVG